jgi:hypothetical protein
MGHTNLKIALIAIEQGHEHLVTTLEAWQEKIVHLLMQMVHGREPQNNEGNNGLEDLREEIGIMQRLVIGSTLMGKVYLGEKLIGIQ